MDIMKHDEAIDMRKNKRINIRIIIFSLLLVFVLGFIFFHSSQNAKASVNASRGFSKSFQAVLDPNNNFHISEFHEYVRKAAHLTEFFALGFSIGGIFYNLSLKYGKKYISLPLLICLSVGICDEFIQIFSARNSTVTDVIIDFAGAVIGLAFIYLSAKFINIINKKRKNKIKK